MTLDVSPVIAGKYTLVRRLAVGGMAEVFLARRKGPEGFEKDVVIKRILPHLAEDPAFVALFLDEARLAAGLRHPNVVDVYEVERDGDSWFIAMEYLQGADASRIVRECGYREEAIPLGNALQIVMDAAAGLHHAHAREDATGKPLQIIHRDISPQNLVVTYDGITKLIDFGIAKAADSASHTSPGAVRGKFAYFSPEQASGGAVDARADQFALGVVLWELTTMVRLHSHHGSAAATLQAIAHGQIRTPSSVVPGYSRDLEAIVMRALSFYPEMRYTDCEGLRAALDAFAEGAQVAHSPARLGPFVRGLFREAIRSDPDAIARQLDAISHHSDPAAPATGLATGAEAPHGVQEENAFLEALAGFFEDPAGTRRGNVLPRADSFVGRGKELVDLGKRLQTDERLITLTGAAGIGKTRLALELASNYSGRGGAWVCYLSDRQGVDGICAAVAEALEVPLGADPVTQLGAALATRGSLLLFLDHFDALLSHAAATIGRWRSVAPQIRFLVTTRELLRLPDEATFEVLPLDPTDAAHLVADRIKGVRGKPVDSTEVVALDEIARRFEGVPLALELAAASLATTSAVDFVRARTDATGAASANVLRDAIERSWSLLAPAERNALATCSVFRGGISIDAASSILEAAPPGAFELLRILREKSLLKLYIPLELAREVRFGLFESVRTFAAERLGDSVAAITRHTTWFLASGARWRAQTETPEAPEGLARLALEIANLLAVQQRSLVRDPESAARAILALEPLLVTRGPFGAHLAMLDAVIERLDSRSDAGLRADLLRARGEVRRARGMIAESIADLEAALALATSAQLQGRILCQLGVGYSVHERDVSESDARYQLALAAARSCGDRFGEGRILCFMGIGEFVRGSKAKALEHYASALTVTRVTGDRLFEGRVVGNFGAMDQEAGRHADARTRYEDALALLRELGERRFFGYYQGKLAGLSWEEGRLPEAVAGFERALGILREVGDVRHEGLFLGTLAGLHARLGEVDRARTELAAAEVMLRGSGDALLLAALTVHRGQLDLAAGDDEVAVDSARRKLAAAKAPGNGGKPSAAVRSDEVRMAVRLLESTSVR